MSTGQEKRASHTPGPWIADNLYMNDDQVVRVSAYDGTPDYYHRCMGIAECFVRDHRHDKDAPHVLQAEANARLIAAAPDLLALARKYASECGNCNGRGYNTQAGEPFTQEASNNERIECEDCADIRDVIAKAVKP